MITSPFKIFLSLAIATIIVSFSFSFASASNHAVEDAVAKATLGIDTAGIRQLLKGEGTTAWEQIKSIWTKTKFSFDGETSGVGSWVEQKATAVVLFPFFIFNFFLNIIVVIGFLFYKYLIYFVLYGFSSIISLDSVRLTWSVFRDFTNILITVFFVYSAFMTIFGNTTYGIKKLGVGIFVGAVFVNFSAFITRIIIDISNYFSIAAGQVFQAQLAAPAKLSIITTIATTGGTDFAQDIEIGQFSSQVGLLIFAILTKLILVFILFYIVIILFYRFFMFILLFVSSPLAIFALALQYSNVQIKGLLGSFAKFWKEALIENSIFIPLFILITGLILSLSDEIVITALVDAGEAGIIQSLFGLLFIMVGLFIATRFLKGMTHAGAGRAGELTEKAVKGTGRHIRKVGKVL